MKDKTTITLDNGQIAEAFAPFIVSASRSTDIPAFYADWFFHRLKTGYSAWTNPFNGVKSYVSYNNTRFIVFWSKNPRPLIKHLPDLIERQINCYIQYTLNDYEIEKLETGVPPLHQRIETFKELSDKIGKKAVIWRFDPMILTDEIGIDKLLEKIENIGNQLHKYTDKLVFSFADISNYKKVQTNLKHNNIPYKEWTSEQMEDFAQKLSIMNKTNGWNLKLATCAEQSDLQKYGIEHNRCIDGDLIVQLAWQDKILMDFMKVNIELAQQNLFETNISPQGSIPLPGNRYFFSTHKKDPGQRKFCSCMTAKDIGEYNTCPHLCEYCYANASKKMAITNWQRHQLNKNNDSITKK